MRNSGITLLEENLFEAIADNNMNQVQAIFSANRQLVNSGIKSHLTPYSTNDNGHSFVHAAIASFDGKEDAVIEVISLLCKELGIGMVHRHATKVFIMSNPVQLALIRNRLAVAGFLLFLGAEPYRFAGRDASSRSSQEKFILKDVAKSLLTKKLADVGQALNVALRILAKLTQIRAQKIDSDNSINDSELADKVLKLVPKAMQQITKALEIDIDFVLNFLEEYIDKLAWRQKENEMDPVSIFIASTIADRMDGPAFRLLCDTIYSAIKNLMRYLPAASNKLVTFQKIISQLLVLRLDKPTWAKANGQEAYLFPDGEKQRRQFLTGFGIGKQGNALEGLAEFAPVTTASSNVTALFATVPSTADDGHEKEQKVVTTVAKTEDPALPEAAGSTANNLG